MSQALVAIAAGFTLAVGQTASNPAQAQLSPAQINTLLAEHNAVRAEVGLDPLTWSADAASFAQSWADNLAANGFALQHSSWEARRPQNLGENLFWSAGQQSTPAQVVGSWASEKQDYNYPQNTCDAVCGHYTQIVWKDTTAVGCGMVGGNHPQYGRQEIWVCNYNPAGNYRGQKPY